MYGILKTKILVKAAMVASAPLAGAMGFAALPPAPTAPFPVVHVQAGSIDYREAGDFAREGRPVNAPVVRRTIEGGITVMKRQVSAAEYRHCVRDGACPARPSADHGREDLPVVGVSWQDATAYATWLSSRTGQAWHLPTDVEWAFFAGSRFHDDAVAADNGSDSFTSRWLAKYDQDSDRKASTDKQARPAGTFGENENGVVDLSGNVWEWTDTCFERRSVGRDGRPGEVSTVNCGVRVVEGEHRTYVTDFIRDARAGGCAVGIPPANLGFRLVRDDEPALRRIIARLQARFSRSG